MGPSITSRKISGHNTTNILLDTFVLYNTEKDGHTTTLPNSKQTNYISLCFPISVCCLLLFVSCFPVSTQKKSVIDRSADSLRTQYCRLETIVRETTKREFLFFFKGEAKVLEQESKPARRHLNRAKSARFLTFTKRVAEVTGPETMFVLFTFAWAGHGDLLCHLPIGTTHLFIVCC